MKEKEVVEYYYKKKFIFRLGYVDYVEAKNPLSLHSHGECTEFVFMLKGRQNYRVNGIDYLVKSGEVFVVYPEEQHSTGGAPEDKAEFFYLIIDLEQVKKLGFFCMDTESDDVSKWSAARCQPAEKSWYSYCREMFSLCNEKKKLWETGIRNQISSLLISMYQNEMLSEEKEKSFWQEEVEQYISTHIYETITVDQLVEISGFSRSYFHTLFLEKMGIPPGEYILRKKIEQSKEELQNTTQSITDIAYHYSFSSSQYFSTVFKRYSSVSPRKFREKHSKMIGNQRNC